MGGRGGGQGQDGGGARVAYVAQPRQAEAGLDRAEQGAMVVGVAASARHPYEVLEDADITPEE
jgi:hypothetical protein